MNDNLTFPLPDEIREKLNEKKINLGYDEDFIISLPTAYGITPYINNDKPVDKCLQLILDGITDYFNGKINKITKEKKIQDIIFEDFICASQLIDATYSSWFLKNNINENDRLKFINNKKEIIKQSVESTYFKLQNGQFDSTELMVSYNPEIIYSLYNEDDSINIFYHFLINKIFLDNYLSYINFSNYVNYFNSKEMIIELHKILFGSFNNYFGIAFNKIEQSILNAEGDNILPVFKNKLSEM